jgi:exodeoxyribonuclease-5
VSSAAWLSADQQGADEAFASWLSAADGSPFLLSGHAGTGKTFLSMRFLAQAEAAGLCWTVVAPTHKAVSVLRANLAASQLTPTWFPSTIHRLLRLNLKRRGDRELCEASDQTAGALEHLDLVLIDEASMLDSTVLELLLRCAHGFRTRLVFVGDPAQLPPVGETASPVFQLARVRKAALEQVVRHQGPVLRLATGLRNGELPCQQPPVLPPIRGPQGLVALLAKDQWLAAAQEALARSAASDNPDLARILCYSNRYLEKLVPLARRALHGEQADQLPVLPGEVLITRAAVMAPACREGGERAERPESPDMVLGSNRELVVREVTPELWDISNLWPSSTELFPPNLATSSLGETNPKYPHSRATDPAAPNLRAPNLGANNLGATNQAPPNFLEADSFNSRLETSRLETSRLETSQLETLTVTVETGEGCLNLRLLPPIGSASRRQLDYILNSLRHQAQLAQQLGDKKRGKLLWRRFFLIRDAFAALGPAAVLTVHRAQGSTFAEVFVADDLFWPQENLLRRQLAYVAVSRASQAVVMLAAEGSQAEQRQWRQWLNNDPN